MTASAASVYDFEATSIDGTASPLSAQRGCVLLIVNTASACGSRRNLRAWKHCGKPTANVASP
jgi:glutathione peroxidase-family protein